MFDDMWYGDDWAVIELDAHGHAVRWNDRCRKLLEYLPDLLSHGSFHPERAAAAFRDAAPGCTLVCVVASSPVEGKEYAWERSAASASALKLRAVLEQTVEAIILADARGVIEIANPAALDMFGYAGNELVGKNVHVLTPPGVRERHQEFMDFFAGEGGTRVIGKKREAYAMRKDGREFPVELSVSEVRGEGRSFYTAIVRDITLQKEREAHLTRLNARLSAKQKLLDESLSAAAEVHRSLLPRCGICYSGVGLAWMYIPSEALGGDMLGVVELGSGGEWLGVFIIDVAGHGVPAALVSMAIVQELQGDAGIVYDDTAIAPSRVLAALDHRFPLKRFGRHCTLFYGVLDTRTGELVYSSAGHPLACIARRDGALVPLDRGGTILGLGGIVPYDEGTATLLPGDRLVLYTDGVTELENGEGEQFGERRLADILREWRHVDAEEALAALQEALAAHAELPGADDVSVLAITFAGQGEDTANV